MSLDQLDTAIVHALDVDGRATYARIGSVLGVSTQTVARRCRRLRDTAGLRVIGLPDPEQAGLTRWLLRITAAPAGARGLADSLVRRGDTQWVKLVSGGTEIFAIVNATDDGDSARAMLLHDLPRTASVHAVRAHCLLHSYFGGPSAWRGRRDSLDEAQQAELTEPQPRMPFAQIRPLHAGDGPLLTALQRDGRASHVELAQATGWSQATVAHRLAELRSAGSIYFDLEIDAAEYGVRTHAMLWLAVEPAHLDTVARELAEHPEVAFVGAITGPSNLMVNALCGTPAELHAYLVTRIGRIDGIRGVETTPVLRTLKASSPIPDRRRSHP
ncbi:Lrp/AsnC family transcriptional regulator [Amycolatopsis jiangsuensis]|uniref:DNA-binding Lrp family transcriptional regulator n=1 Tax=Amycolatopsis jiangsuensis TaxID=1181879 RepID=A0A840IQ48_9PSEU|nr:AsnC family transcriptional regulator [Amycolatopsis jiangsuensis]MBB4683507.1 DNA-binding Lrp family transcriptional regulator [Amycolatopsis jiangsuensis]